MTSETPRELRNIERASSRLRADRATLDALVREAYDKRLRDSMDRAYSLRVIAEAAGLSHEQVRRIVQQGARQDETTRRTGPGPRIATPEAFEDLAKHLPSEARHE